LLAFGVATLDFFSWKWIVLGLAIYSIPLAGQALPNVHLRVWSLWLGLFVALQVLISPLVIDVDFVTLPRGLDTIVDVKGGLPGIAGKQHITTDEKGFRVTTGVDYESDDTYRVFAIGGSTTEQIYLDDRKTWTHLLEESLAGKVGKKIEVINTGVAGLRSPNHVATLEYVLAYHPDLVIFLMGLNDWNHHIKQSITNRKESGLANWKPRRQLFLRNSMFGKLASGLIDRLTTEEVLKTEVREDHGEYYTHQRGSLERDEKRQFLPDKVDYEFEASLFRIGEICDRFNLSCMFLSQPSGYSSEASEKFKSGFWMTPPNEDYALTFDSMVHIASLYNDHLSRFAASNNHEFCDISKNIAPTYGFFYDDCHFNEKGAQLVAELLTHCLAPLIR